MINNEFVIIFVDDQFVMPPLEKTAQHLRSPVSSYASSYDGGYAPAPAAGGGPQVIHDYNHRQSSRGGRAPQDARLDPNAGAAYENFEMVGVSVASLVGGGNFNGCNIKLSQ